MAKAEAQCLLGHGACPITCLHHEAAVKVTAELGQKFNPEMSRLAVVFGDAFKHDINVTHVAAALQNCALEGLPTNPRS